MGKNINIKGSVYLDNFLSEDVPNPEIIGGNNNISNTNVSEYYGYGEIACNIMNPDVFIYEEIDDKRCTISAIKQNGIYNEIQSLGSDLPLAIPATASDGKIITSISSFVFTDISDEFSLVLPSSIYRLENDAMNNCVGLQKLIITNTQFEIGNRALYGCSALTYINGIGNITYIGEEALSRTNIKKLSLDNFGEHVTIKPYGISNCAITSIEIPDNSYIYEYAFFNTPNLYELKIGENSTITEPLIGYDESLPSDEKINKLGYIYIPKSVIIIKYNSNYPIVDTSTVVISTDTTSVPDDYIDLQTVSIKQIVEYWNSKNSVNKLTYVSISDDYKNGDYRGLFKYLAVNDYVKNTDLNKVLKSYVTTTVLNNKGYQNSSQVTNSINNKLSSYYNKTQVDNLLPENLKDLKIDSLISKLYYPGHEHEINYYDMKPGLVISNLEEFNADEYSVCGINYSHFNYENKFNIVIPPFVKYSGKIYKISAINSPSSYSNEKNTLYFTSSGHKNGNFINNLYLPSTIRIMYRYAFMEPLVNNIIFSEGIESIGYMSLAESKLDNYIFPKSLRILYNDSLYLSTISKLKIQSDTYTQSAAHYADIYDFDIENKDKIDPLTFKFVNFIKKNIMIPPSIKTIGYGAFASTILNTVDLNNVKEIRPFAFAYSQISEIHIPDKCNYIGESAFDFCQNLKYVSISENIRVIPKRCFGHTPNLIAVYIPDSVISIANDAFDIGEAADSPFKYTCSTCGRWLSKTSPSLSNWWPCLCTSSITWTLQKRTNNITIYCKEGSYASKWIEYHNNKCKNIDKLNCVYI